jgi:hypothetical protein
MPSLHLHLRVIRRPTITVPVALQTARSVLAQAKLNLVILSNEEINDSVLGDIPVSGNCQGKGALSPDQMALFATTASARDEILIFFVRSTNPVLSGCARHPDGKPGALVTEDCSRFTLAHELGHVLGLSHGGDSTRLMHECTCDITVARPRLIQPEIDMMLKFNPGLIHP